MTTIELTDEQRRALQAEPGRPLDVIDPATQQRYVLVAQEHYKRVCASVEEKDLEQSSAINEVPPGILRSQHAFWRELPGLLSQSKLRGKWVCYHGDERVGTGKYEELIRECLRRGLRRDEYELGVVEPHTLPPWEAEEIESGGHEGDYVLDETENVGGHE
jgi:hypothetical protein